jgi:glucose-1-phosphate adenylyltransferase
VFNLYNDQWPLYTGHDPLPPAKFVHNEGDRVGHALESLVSAGVIISGGTALRSILSPGVVLHSHAHVEDSVLMGSVKVGRGAIVRRAIIDKNVVIPDGARIGFDLEDDRSRFAVTRSGVVVIGKNEIIER